MREEKLVICDRNEKYLQAMQEYFLKRKTGLFEIQGFTDIEQLMQGSKEEAPAILLISEELYQEQVKEIAPHKIYILDEGMGLALEYPHIAKYQSMELLIQRLLEEYMLHETAKSKFILGKRARLTTFYAPYSTPIQTECALAAGHELVSKGRRVLYLNFHAFAGFETLLHTHYEADITDLIYFMQKHSDKIRYKLESVKRKLGELDYIPPADNFQDLLTLSEDDWEKILGLLETQTEYDDIVIDVSQICVGLYQILDKSNRIFMPNQKNHISEAAIIQYERLLMRQEKQKIIEKTKRYYVEESLQNRAYGYETQVHTPIGELMKKLLWEDSYAANAE